jgi:hypothetical protein
MNHPTVICLLGMHRSGTSLLARVLNLLGVSLGPAEHLMKPAAANPKGFWEHEPIVRINEKILSALGGSWQKVPSYASGWETSPAFDGLKARAREVIQRDFASAEIWGWKDPRTCLTLPFWQQLLPTMRYVICVRNPIDVSRSLERRDGFSIEKGVYLWLNYLRLAFTHTEGRPRVVVFYEDMVDSWQSQLGPLSHFIGKPERAGLSDVQTAIQGFIDTKLHHHRTLLRVSEGNNGTPSKDIIAGACNIYAKLKEGFAGQDVIDQMLRSAIEEITPRVRKQESESYQSWVKQVKLSTQEIRFIVPRGDRFILVDDGQWNFDESDSGHYCTPYMEQGGQYWGPPPDDDTAIRELERLRKSGANYMVFAWPAFWWLDHYPGLHDYLNTDFSCLLKNERVIVFDLRVTSDEKAYAHRNNLDARDPGAPDGQRKC